jgi:hypothetical protein
MYPHFEAFASGGLPNDGDPIPEAWMLQDTYRHVVMLLRALKEYHAATVSEVGAYNADETDWSVAASYEYLAHKAEQRLFAAAGLEDPYAP